MRLKLSTSSVLSKFPLMVLRTLSKCIPITRYVWANIDIICAIFTSGGSVDNQSAFVVLFELLDGNLSAVKHAHHVDVDDFLPLLG